MGIYLFICRKKKTLSATSMMILLQMLWELIILAIVQQQELKTVTCLSSVGQVLTVIAEWPTEGGHAAVTAEAVPLLQANSLIWTWVLLAGSAGPWKKFQKKLGFF